MMGPDDSRSRRDSVGGSGHERADLQGYSAADRSPIDENSVDSSGGAFRSDEDVLAHDELLDQVPDGVLIDAALDRLGMTWEMLSRAPEIAEDGVLHAFAMRMAMGGDRQSDIADVGSPSDGTWEPEFGGDAWEAPAGVPLDTEARGAADPWRPPAAEPESTAGVGEHVGGLEAVDRAGLDPTWSEVGVSHQTNAIDDGQSVPHWRNRTRGHLTDRELGQRVEETERRVWQLGVERLRVENAVLHHRVYTAEGRGPHALEVDRQMDELRQELAVAREVERLESAWHAATTRLADAVEHRVQAENERDELGALARVRRLHLQREIVSDRETQLIERQTSAALADRIAELREPYAELRRVHDLEGRVANAEATYSTDRRVAQERDEELEARDTAELMRVCDREFVQMNNLQLLQDEQQLRAHLPEHLRLLEAQERGAEHAESALDHGVIAPQIDIAPQAEVVGDPHILDAGEPIGVRELEA
jgi:hypothetical protein